MWSGGHQALDSNFQLKVTPQLPNNQQLPWNKNQQVKGKRKKAFIFTKESFVINTNLRLFMTDGESRAIKKRKEL